MNEPPIQNLDSVDLTAVRNDGGVDLIIVASSHLDGSVATQRLLKEKLQTYVDALAHPDFRSEFGIPDPNRAAIIVACADQPAAEIVALLEHLRPFVEKQGASLCYKVGI